MFKVDASAEQLINSRDSRLVKPDTSYIASDIGVIIGDLNEIKEVCVGQTYTVHAVDRNSGKIWLKFYEG